MQNRGPTLFTIVLAIVGVLLLLVMFGSGFYTDWLWFSNLGYSSVFVLGVQARWLLGLVSGGLLALFLWVNLRMALAGRAGALPGIIELPIGPLVAPRRIQRYLLVGSLVLGGFIGLNMSTQWLPVLRYLRQVPFGVIEPIFNQDVAKYVFTLPVLSLLYQYLMSALVLAVIGVALLYVLTADLNFDARRVRLSSKARAHVSLLAAGIFGVKAIGYRVNLYTLLYSPRGQVFGASFTDVNAQAVALRLLMVITLAVAALLLVNIRLRRTALIAGGVVVMLAVSFILGTLYPTFVQQFTVEPDELNKERDYIGYNISYTRTAWGLDRIEELEYPLRGELTLEDIEANRATIDNIRLWAYRPLKTTYSQLQEIRLYYAFNDADIDRYRFGDDYRQVAIAVRELDINLLPERTWINQHLVFTHGYGVIMSPVNRATVEGLPEFWIRDVPPRLSGPPAAVGFSIDQVRSYYGELTRTYAIVNTETPEFDYPLGEINATIRYDGRGGVQLSSPLIRLAFAVRLRSYQIFLANVITPESRIMFYRNINERVRRIAPFLRYDQDPYPIVVDGNLYWVIDAYTHSNGYPYSEPLRRINANYVRNSVKVVIDAYHGDTVFYVFDDEDPLVQTYARVFPALFRSGDEMSANMRAHMRYPIDYFQWQSEMLLTYHMRDSVAFYNKEDVWTIPQETYGARTQAVEPYYLILKLADAVEPEYALLMPFTPRGRNNMIAWMAARSDGELYGDLILYRFPRAELVFGPAQIEARIDQDTVISRDLTLWGQRGSEVIRGHLLVIPINDSILYVEPIYLQADATGLPEMKQVVVSYRDRVVMDDTLARALARIFGESPGVPTEPGDDQTVAELIARAVNLFNQSEQALRDGDWAEYGRLQAELRQVLGELESRAQETP